MAFVSVTTNTGTSATPSATVPASPQADDIDIILLAMDSASCTVDPGDIPAGFTELAQLDLTFDGQMGWVGWKRLTGSESGSYSFLNVANSSAFIAMVFRFRGRHATNPPVISANASSNSGNSSPVTITANGVTALDGDDLFWVSMPDVNTNNAGNGHTAPSGYAIPAGGDQEFGFDNVCGAYKENVSAGATGSVAGSFALSAGLSAWEAWLIRLPAAPGGGGATLRKNSLMRLGVGR